MGPVLLRLVAELIEIGRGDEDRLPASAPTGEAVWMSVAENHEALYVLAKALPIAELDLLIRGFVRASRANRSMGLGSVSPVVQLLRTLSWRDRSAEERLTPWILANRVNPYEPFGTHVDVTTARTLAEFADIKWKAAQLHAAALAERLAQEQAARDARRSDHATRQLWNAVRRGDLRAVKALLDLGAQPAAATRDGQSLRSVAIAFGRHAVAEYLRERGIE